MVTAIDGTTVLAAARNPILPHITRSLGDGFYFLNDSLDAPGGAPGPAAYATDSTKDEMVQGCIEI